MKKHFNIKNYLTFTFLFIIMTFPFKLHSKVHKDSISFSRHVSYQKSETAMKKKRTHSQSKYLHIKPRYYRWHVDPGVEWTEANTRYAHLDWKIPISQAAIVLVDVWKRHYLREPEERANKIIEQKIVPLLTVCRQAGLQLIHAPAPEVAKVNPKWLRLVSEEELNAVPTPDWPPQEFRQKTGAYAAYARPKELRQKEIDQLVANRSLHPLVQPEGDEVVIINGEELHRFCKQKNILFLFFLGFNTNACILMRDYGTLEMAKRGYEVIIIRDCTTGMESFETQSTLAQTKGAITFLEMFGKYSVTSEQIINGLKQ